MICMHAALCSLLTSQCLMALADDGWACVRPLRIYVLRSFVVARPIDLAWRHILITQGQQGSAH